MRQTRQQTRRQGPGTGVGSPGTGGRGILSPGFLEGIFSQAQFPNAIKEFVHPGKEAGELLMRIIFKDEREANAAVLYLSKCEEFKMERHRRLLLHRLAATVSIKGVGRNQLLQAVVGHLAPGVFSGDGKKGKRREEED